MSTVELGDLESILNIERIPHRSWDEVRKDVFKQWNPRDRPHHSIISITGGGKSYLATRGLLPMRGWRKVLIIDNKGDDETLRDVGKRIRQIPKRDPYLRNRKQPDSLWYRLMVSDDWGKGREQVKEALQQ